MSRRHALLLAAAIGLVGCARFDPPIEAELVADDRWADVEAVRDHRLAIAAALVNAARSSPARDEPAVAEVAEARARANLRMTGEDLADPQKVTALLRADGTLRDALPRLCALRAKYPGLWAEGDLAQAEAQLTAVNHAYVQAMDAYAAAVRAYDLAIAPLPHQTVNRLTGKRFLPRQIISVGREG